MKLVTHHLFCLQLSASNLDYNFISKTILLVDQNKTKTNKEKQMHEVQGTSNCSGSLVLLIATLKGKNLKGKKERI